MLRTLRVLALAAAVAMLAACSSGSGFSDLDREATAADVLPSGLPAHASEDFADDSVRFVGELDGVEYYLAWMDDAVDVCVVAYRSADEWIGGCGGPNGSFGLSGSLINLFVAPDGSPELDEGTPVGANIVVR